MSHDQDKQCLDDRIMVDPSNGRSRGCWTIDGIAVIMKCWLPTVKQWFRLVWSTYYWNDWR